MFCNLYFCGDRCLSFPLHLFEKYCLSLLKIRLTFEQLVFAIKISLTLVLFVPFVYQVCWSSFTLKDLIPTKQYSANPFLSVPPVGGLTSDSPLCSLNETFYQNEIPYQNPSTPEFIAAELAFQFVTTNTHNSSAPDCF